MEMPDCVANECSAPAKKAARGALLLPVRGGAAVRASFGTAGIAKETCQESPTGILAPDPSSGCGLVHSLRQAALGVRITPTKE